MKLTGLEQYWGKKNTIPKLRNPELCPDCGDGNIEQHEYYYRCNNRDCDTITFFKTDVTIKPSRFWK